MDDRLMEEHSKRLTELERGQVELTAAVSKIANSSDSRREHIDYRFNAMNDQIKETGKAASDRFNKLDANINKMLWLIGAALVGGVMQFIANGGLTSV